MDCGMVAGSISLVAPELRRGEPPSPASDMYAVGGLMLWVRCLNDKFRIMILFIFGRISGWANCV